MTVHASIFQLIAILDNVGVKPGEMRLVTMGLPIFVGGDYVARVQLKPEAFFDLFLGEIARVVPGRSASRIVKCQARITVQEVVFSSMVPVDPADILTPSAPSWTIQRYPE